MHHEALVNLPDLSGIQSLSNPRALSDRDYADFVDEGAPPQRAADRSRSSRLALPPATAVIVPIQLTLEDTKLAPVVFEDHDGKTIVVSFDNYTHSSGKRRAFVYCDYKHENCCARCRRYAALCDKDGSAPPAEPTPVKTKLEYQT